MPDTGGLTFPLRLQKQGLLYSDCDHLQSMNSFEKIQVISLSLISFIDLAIKYFCEVSHCIIHNHRLQHSQNF